MALASPTRRISFSFKGRGPGSDGLHRGSASQRFSANLVDRFSRISPSRLIAGRLAGRVALSLTTSKSPGSSSSGKSVNAW